MPVQLPTIAELRTIADRHGLGLDDEDLASFRELMTGVLPSYEEVERLPEQTLPVRYPRDSGWRPAAEDNPLNAWYWRCSITGAEDGLLAGRRIAIKDNVAVAGVPMMNGCSVLEGYVPEVDATVVTRILEAGGEIVGKAACEDLCFSGGSHTCRTGPIRNPWNSERSAGGSSGGSAALVANGDVDLALGGDQGGSVRIPSCWCGTVGHKPTHGLVPYTGAFPIELTLDHLGPIGRTVGEVAVFLEAIAGTDGLDPRQPSVVEPEAYSQRVAETPDGLTVAVVTEGFGWPELSEPDVDDTVREAAQRFEQAGARVEEVSIPLHRAGIHVWNAIAVEGATALMIKGNAFATNYEGFYTTSLLDAYARGRTSRGHDLSETVKLVLLLGEYMYERYHGRYYAKAQNAAPALRAAYDEALADADVLCMPTLPLKATPLPDPAGPRAEWIARALEMLPNTAPFDVTGHPAITVPCGLASGLPVGMMLVGRRWDDTTVLQAAHAFEQAVGGFEALLGRPAG
jgi:amidase